MGLKDLDFESAFRRLADKRVDDAMKEGKFDIANLPGYGKEIDLEEAPAEENARMLWWALRIMKNADVIPEEIQWRKAIDKLKGEISQTTDEKRLTLLVGKVSDLVHKLNTLGTNAIRLGVSPLDLQDELARLRGRTQ